MKYLCLLLFLLPSLARAQAAPFSGYYAIEEKLGQRILADGSPLDLSQYTSDQGLLFLMGYWDNNQTPHVFLNSQANALNMLIYYVGLSALATDLAASCQPPYPIKMNPAFAQALAGVCTWPADSAKSDAVLLSFWTALMGYDAPEDEFNTWHDYFRQGSWSSQTAAQTVRAMSLSIMMNPYFLIND